MDTIKIEKKNTLMVAHRGVSGLEKENTLAAFVAAGNRSYYGVETDVHRTADGKYVVIHDSDTARVSPLHVEIEKSAYDTIRGVMLNDIDGTCGRTDLRGGSYEEIMVSLKRLGQLEGDYHVCPGHDRTSTLERERQYNPFLREAMGQ